VYKTGIESIVLDMPKPTRTWELFDKAKEIYLEKRKLLLPQFEGWWLLINVDSPEIVLLSNKEEGVRNFKLSDSRFYPSYYNCLGREVMLFEIVKHITEPDDL